MSAQLFDVALQTIFQSANFFDNLCSELCRKRIQIFLRRFGINYFERAHIPMI